MRIDRIQTEGVGPLPPVDWRPGDCAVVYDDNQTGKTTLIDLLIDTVLSEGRKTIFEDQDRYASLPDTTVQLTEGEESYTFTDEGAGVELSRLLGWNLPELNRLLCVRASEVGMGGGSQEDADIWKALASVIEGLEDDYVEKLKKTICDQANITARRFAWSSTKGNDHFKETILNEVVPTLDRADEAEDRLAELLHRREQRRDLQETVNALREETIPEQKQAIKELEKQLARLDLRRSERELEEALTLRNRLQQEFGRVDPAFEDPWEQARDQLEALRRDKKQRRQREETREERRAELEEERDAIRGELQELRAEIDREEDRLERREEALERRREETLGLQQQAADLLRRFEAGPVPPGGVAPLTVLLGLAVLLSVPWIPLDGLAVGVSYGLGGVLLLAGLVAGGLRYRRRRRRRTLVERSRDLFDELDAAPPEETSVPDRLRAFADASPDEYLREDRRAVKQLRGTLQEQGERRSSLETRLENLEERLEELREPTEDDENLAASIEEHEATCESYRQKTGLPDFETYRERLADRRKIEGELENLVSRLQGRLDLEAEDLDLPDIQTVLDRRREALEDVTPPEDDREALEAELKKQRATLEELEARLHDREEQLNRVESTLRDEDQLLHELGVDPDEPGTLFEVKRDLGRRLEKAVRDRLAGALILRLLDSLEEGYLDRVRELLVGSNGEDDWSLSHLYGSVMGEEHRVEFDPETLGLTVHADGLELPETVLSSGARKHLYLSCRLVALRRLFGERPGFMLLDDPFLTYFPARKRRAIDLLEPLMEDDWQMLFFTVDPDTRDYLIERFGADEHGIDDLATRSP